MFVSDVSEVIGGQGLNGGCPACGAAGRSDRPIAGRLLIAVCVACAHLYVIEPEGRTADLTRPMADELAADAPMFDRVRAMQASVIAARRLVG